MHQLFNVLFLCTWPFLCLAQTTFFNEVDYKAAPADQCLEILSPESQDRTGWNVLIYKDNGFLIETVDIGIIPPSATVNGLDIIIVDVVLLTDDTGGMAIEDNNGTIIQFLNYGAGTITAQDGPASGLTSENIGVQATAGMSLQLTGIGVEYPEFTWDQPGPTTCGESNIDQFILTALPSELTDFRAARKEEGVFIEWRTLSEFNSLDFRLKRSTDGASFEEIYRVDAAGYSVQERTYSYIDLFPPEGQLYYQLILTDIDGTKQKSDIVSIDNTASRPPFTIFPNPADNEIHIFMPQPTESLHIEIFDLTTGRLLSSVLFDEPVAPLHWDISHLSRGLYLLRLKSTDHVQDHRLIKIGFK